MAANGESECSRGNSAVSVSVVSNACASASASASSSTLEAKHNLSGFRFRPCIDIREGKVTQIVGSSLQIHSNSETINGFTSVDSSSAQSVSSASSSESTSAVVNFISTRPSSYFSSLYRSMNLTGGHIIMLGQSMPNELSALAALAAFPEGMQIGGGIRADNADKFLTAGASHVILTSFIFHDGKIDRNRLKELVQKIGKSRLVLDLSCRRKAPTTTALSPATASATTAEESSDDFWIVTDGWQKYSSEKVSAHLLAELSECCAEFLIHAVDVEGKRGGIDETLVQLLAKCVPVSFPITYAGGIHCLEDIEKVWRIGNGKIDVSIGSALDIFGGQLKIMDVVKYVEQLRQSRSKT